MTATQYDRAQAAFAEIERLRMATDEGSLAKRADRMWEIASEMLGRPVAGAAPLEIVPEPYVDTAHVSPRLVDAVKATVAYIDGSEREWGNLPVAQRVLRKKCRAALAGLSPEVSASSDRVSGTITVPDKAFVAAAAEFQRSQNASPNLAWFDHLKAALTEVWPECPRETTVSEVLEAADEWFRERAPAERGDLGMQTAFKDGATWAIGQASENSK